MVQLGVLLSLPSVMHDKTSVAITCLRKVLYRYPIIVHYHKKVKRGSRCTNKRLTLICSYKSNLNEDGN